MKSDIICFVTKYSQMKYIYIYIYIDEIYIYVYIYITSLLTTPLIHCKLLIFEAAPLKIKRSYAPASDA